MLLIPWKVIWKQEEEETYSTNIKGQYYNYENILSSYSYTATVLLRIHVRITSDCNLLLLVLVNIQLEHASLTFMLAIDYWVHSRNINVHKVSSLSASCCVSHYGLFGHQSNKFETNQFSTTVLEHIFKKMPDDDQNMDWNK